MTYGSNAASSEKEGKMKKYLSPFFIISAVLLCLSLIVYSLSISFVFVADAVNNTVSVLVRFVLSSVTYLLPFSFFELLILLIIPILILTVILIVKGGKTRVDRVRKMFSLIGVIALVFTSYIYTLGVGYHTTALSSKIGIENKRDVTADELYYTVNTVLDELNVLAEKLDLTDGQTHMPYSFDEMSSRLIDAYDEVNERYSLLTNFTSRAKPVYFSTVMSDLGISGIYSFFTGEANVNVEYPDYCVPFTAAHELAHQRGISRENEANFVAFLVCISSEDDYIRYSGYLNMYEYLASALYRADTDLYYDVRSRLSNVVISDMRASNAVYQKHKDSILGKINDKLNDAYLKANGTDGVVTYGYVVRLAVSYYQSES